MKISSLIFCLCIILLMAGCTAKNLPANDIQKTVEPVADEQQAANKTSVIADDIQDISGQLDDLEQMVS